jgi:hypothetical protein
MPAPLKLLVCVYCRRWRQLLWATLFGCVALVAVPAVIAQELTTDEAVARARQQVPGKLVAVGKEQQGDQTVYRVRILGADGVVRTVFINANP